MQLSQLGHTSSMEEPLTILLAPLVFALPLRQDLRHGPKSYVSEHTCPIQGPHALANTVAPTSSSSLVT